MFAEDGIGRLLGVCGSAFCANLERIGYEGLWSESLPVEAVLRKLLHKPRGEDHLLEPEEFHDHRASYLHPKDLSPFDSPVQLGDAGLGFNHPLPPLLQPEREVKRASGVGLVETGTSRLTLSSRLTIAKCFQGGRRHRRMVIGSAVLSIASRTICPCLQWT